MLSLATIGCYFGLWNAYFSSDDFWMLGWVRQQPSLAGAVWAEFGYSVRILLDMVLWLRVHAFGLDPSPYYWVSLLQHITVVLMVYWLATFWTKRRDVALIAALVFGTTSSHFEVVTWITGSNYSLAAIPYLFGLACFGMHARCGGIGWYLSSLAAFVASLLLTELAISFPLVIVAYSLTLGRDPTVRPVSLRYARTVLPFWILLAVYLVIQLHFLNAGNSEAARADQVYRPGLHILSNLSYLLYLAFPPYGPPFLANLIGAAPVNAALTILAVGGHALALLLIWRGSPVVRFALAFMYLTYLPYTLWQGDFAGAIRYRYLPAIGFALLLALLLTTIHDRLVHARASIMRFVIPGVVVVLVATNVLFVQTWVKRHLDNSSFRRLAVTQLASQYSSIPAGTQFYIEVPADKFADIGRACQLVFLQPTRCQAVSDGTELQAFAALNASQDTQTYLLRATDRGLQQVYPTTPANS